MPAADTAPIPSLLALDFDKTIARTDEERDDIVGVEQAYEIAVEDVARHDRLVVDHHIQCQCTDR